ncbi:MAG: methionyl-tRNA formyltransferase [Eubacteriales bacterium]|nr:methionyl-tRNA formyltransferase [Eubacteriales bacterium]
MKIVYMGTPDFAVGPLKALLNAGHTVTAVVTQPDKPKGRGGRVQMSPVKMCALEHGIEVFQPVKIKAPEAVEQLKRYEADVFVVAAFGQILSQEILDMPRFGCLCIHASLLPAYRGAAPIQWVLLNGEKETGVTIMQMDAGIDTGDMLLKAVVEIAEKETDESLHDKLAEAGSGLIVEALKKLEAGELTAQKQNDGESCYAKILTKSMGQIDWNETAEAIERKVRGLHSWPGAYTFYQGKMLKIFQADTVMEPADGKAGEVSRVTKDAICVNTGKGTLILREIQLEGKKRMAVKDFLLGYKIGKGDQLG